MGAPVSSGFLADASTRARRTQPWYEWDVDDGGHGMLRGRSAPSGCARSRVQGLGLLLLLLALPPYARAREDDAAPRYQPEVLEGDLVVGAAGAPVTLIALVRLSECGDGSVAPALLRLAGRADAEGVRVVLRPRVPPSAPTDVRLARLFHALPDDGARLRWLAELAGEGASPERAALRFAVRGGLVERGNAPGTDRRLIAALHEQVRLQVRNRDVVFVNGQRLEPAPDEARLLQALQGEARRAARGAGRVTSPPGSPSREGEGSAGGPDERPGEGASRRRQAEEIGPRTLEVPVRADGRLDLALFVDWRDPHSKRVAGHVAQLLRDSELAELLHVRLRTLALDRHPEALPVGALARCLAEHVAPDRLLAALFGERYQRPDAPAQALCDALVLPVATCAWMTGCAALAGTAAAVSAEGDEARRAGAHAPPALFLEGRRIVPQGRGFSRAFLEDVLLGYHLRTWTLPPDGRLE